MMMMYWVQQVKGKKEVTICKMEVMRVHNDRVYFHAITGRTWSPIKSEQHEFFSEPGPALADAAARVTSLRLMAELELYSLKDNEDRILSMTVDSIPEHPKKISYA